MINILEHVIPVFRTYGIKSVTMDDISKHLGISKKTLYVHYKSKDVLVEQSVVAIFQNHYSKFNTILERDISPLKKVILMYRYGIRQLTTNTTIFYAELKKYYPKLFKYYQKEREYITFTMVLDLLKQAQKEGDIIKELNLDLYCRLNLHKIDSSLLDPELNQSYTLVEIVDHLIIYNLRGILTNGAVLE